MKRFYLRILLPTILTVLLFILTIFLVVIPRFQQNIMNGKREMIMELTNSAWSILAKYESDERNGLISRDEAQKSAISRIQYLRYGEESKDYFWITDMGPSMVMHPFRADLNGKDLSNFSDPHGKKLFVEFVETVKKSEHGYVNYMWQWKDDSLHIVPKLSYVRIFKPWNWVIGTGIYIEDVKKEMSSLSRRLLWISGGISILIALLLFYIIKQSLNTERKRIEAENDLHESKEKYRTLVEAATEGLLMLIDGKINFANSVLSKMIGYDSSDLINHTLAEIISENNNKDIVNNFIKGPIIIEGKFELNIKRKGGGFIEALVTSSTASFSGNTVNIIIIKDISIDRHQSFSNLDYQKLISSLNLGFFKIRIDTKGKILYANETAIRILGFENFNELSETNALRLFSDPEERRTLRKGLITDGFVKNRILEINKKSKQQTIVSVTLVVIENDNTGHLICDGIIEDITTKEQEKANIDNLITELKTSSFLIEQSIKKYISPVYTLEYGATINDAIKTLALYKTDCVVLTKDERDCIGIITSSDIQTRVLSLRLNVDNPAYLIMSSPILYAGSDTAVIDAIRNCEERNIGHLLVKDESGSLIGVFNTKTISKAIKYSLSFFLQKVAKSETNEELKQCYKELQLFIKPLIKSDVSVKYITNLTSSFSDAVIRRIIELSKEKIGKEPVDFSFICLGSEGRREETLLTDQDNAIIYEDVPAEREAVVSAYFLKLGEMVCNSLAFVGYSHCKGNIMAKNPHWNKPFSTWQKYFTNWIVSPEPQNLLEATIFFDVRSIYGNGDFTLHLRKLIDSLVSQQNVFLYHLAYDTFNTKTQSVSSASNRSEKDSEVLDLKASISQLIMFTRTYALQHNIHTTNTIERLSALKTKSIIESRTIDEIVFAYNFLMKLRFRNHIHQLENNIPLSNLLDTRGLIDMEISILKRVLTQMTAYQNKLNVDFRLST